MANALTKFYDSALAGVGLTANQLSLLTDIHTIQPCNRTELARCARLDRTTVIRNLEVLAKKGLAETAPGIRLTELGTRTMEEGFLRWKEAQGKVRSIFDADTRAVLKEAFSQIGQIEALLDE